MSLSEEFRKSKFVGRESKKLRSKNSILNELITKNNTFYKTRLANSSDSSEDDPTKPSPYQLQQSTKLASRLQMYNFFKRIMTPRLSRQSSSVTPIDQLPGSKINSSEQSDPMKLTGDVLLEPFLDEPPIKERLLQDLVLRNCTLDQHFIDHFLDDPYLRDLYLDKLSQKS